MSMARRHRGFTLLELMVAVALLAVLALLSWRGMASVLQGRDRIVAASDDLRALSVALSQMEEDLRRSWPVRLLGLPEPSIYFDPGSDREPPALHVLRETVGVDAAPLQRVVYRLRGAVLERGFGAWAAASLDGGQRAPAPTVTWQPLLNDVSGLQFRGWLSGRGWLPSGALGPQQFGSQAGAAAGEPPGAGQPATVRPGAGMITGVEVMLVRRDERIVRVFAVGH